MLYKQIEQNKRKTVLLVLLFCAIVLAAGGAIGYLGAGDVLPGFVLTAVILAVYVPVTYMSASAQVLRMAHARPAAREDYPQLYNIVEELSIPARIPVPRIYVIDDPSPNAFATGLKPAKGAVAFTTGLLERLNREEIEAVAAHELAHIRNYDIRLMTFTIALISVIAVMADLGFRMMLGGGQKNSGNRKQSGALILIALALVILSPLASRFVHLAVSRNREYLADATAVELTRNPKGLSAALLKISDSELDVRHARKATASMYIASPLSRARNKPKTNWFSTHPSMASRIERLERM